MHGQNDVESFEFDDYGILDEVTRIDRQIIISEGKRYLPSKVEAPLFEFVQQTSFIRAFEQSRPDDRVHAHRRADDDFANSVF